jgi:hypothetical protein
MCGCMNYISAVVELAVLVAGDCKVVYYDTVYFVCCSQPEIV